MKQLNAFINEKLIIHKDIDYEIYKPNDKDELIDILKERWESKEQIKQGAYALDVSRIDVSKLTDIGHIFDFLDTYEKISIKELHGIDEWDVHNIENMSGLFANLGIKSIDVSNWDVRELRFAMSMFSDCLGLKEVIGLEKWKTSNLQVITFMFNECRNLEKVDISTWDTQNVHVALGMFNECRSLKTVGDIADWNLKKMQSVEQMFYNCKKLKLDIRKWKLTYLSTHISHYSINSFADFVKID